MVNHIKPLPFYQELIYYTGVITLGGIILVIYFIFGNRDSSNLMVPFLLISFVFGVVTYLIWDTRCPYCKRPFVKKEDKSKEKDLGTRKEKREFDSEILKIKSSGEEVDRVKGYKMWPAHYVQRYFYCKKCNYGKNDEWHDNEDGIFKGWEDNAKWNPPKPKTVYVKENEDGDYVRLTNGKSSNGKIIVRPLNHRESQRIIVKRGNKCQWPNCGHDISLDVHHIVSRSNGGTNRESNLIVLCKNHHQQADRGSINATRLKMIISKTKKK